MRAAAYLTIAVLLLASIPASSAARAPAADFPLPEPRAYLESLKLDAPATLARPSILAADGVTSVTYGVWIDGVALDASKAQSVELYPNLTRRRYAEGVVEETSRLDKWLAIRLSAPSAARLAVAPIVSGHAARAERTASEAWFVVEATPRAGLVAARVEPDIASRVAAESDRIARLLLASYVATADPRFDRALAWMKLASEAPGANAVDALVALPGHLLVTGRLDEARALLERTARLQVLDERDPTFGLLRGHDAAATCWLVRAAFEYVLYSGDLAFAKKLYPAILAATDGAMRLRIDSEGLLKGEPVDVQALWFAQLEASARLAHLVTDKEASERWERHGARVRRAFRERFPAPDGALAERLNADGTQAGPGGPRQILALTASFEPMLSLAEGRGVLRAVATRPGIDDRLAGQLATALARYHREDLAFALSRDAADRMLTGLASGRGALLPAAAAELVRAVYVAYLGLRPDATAEQIAFDPTVPAPLGTVRAVVPFAGGRLKVTLEPLGGGRTRCLLFGERLAAPIEVVVGAPGPQGMVEGAESFMLAPGGATERIHVRRSLPPRADPGDLRRVSP